MTPDRVAKEHYCKKSRCGKSYTSVMRLQHHWAAEHTPKTLRDIRTVKDIPTMQNLSLRSRQTLRHSK